jgi:DNA (cytosine-5)-methyltransferase 1
MSRPLLLDLYCKAGGASKGYFDAGFDVIGVDIEHQPNYPYWFVQGDALEFLAKHGHSFDAIHASPPCQHYSRFTPNSHKDNHADLIDPTRQLLKATGKPYVIENVSGARKLLVNPIMLCGSMVGLPIWRHRWFELSPNNMLLTPPCRHDFKPVLITDNGGPNANGWGKPRKRTPVAAKREAAGIDWMTSDEITEAIPPAFTEWIARQHLLGCLVAQAA